MRGASASSWAMPGQSHSPPNAPYATGNRGCPGSARSGVGFAVADHRRARPVDGAVLQVVHHQADPGLRVGSVSAEALSISTSRKRCPGSRTLQHQLLRSVEGGLRIRLGAQAVLVADHHELVAGIAQAQQRRNHAVDEAELFVGIDLEIGGLRDQRAVAVDEQDRASCDTLMPRRQRAAPRARASFCAGVPMLMRSASSSSGGARMSRTTTPARAGVEGGFGIVEANQQEICLRRVDAPHARQRPARLQAFALAPHGGHAPRVRERLRRQRVQRQREHGAGNGYGAWQRRSTAISSASAITHADARRGQRMRLGQGAQHGQVRLRREQRDRGGHVGELAVGFVHHHQRAAVERACERQRSSSSGATCPAGLPASTGRPASRRCAALRGHRVEVRAEFRRRVAQRHFDQARVLEARADGIHAEHRRRDETASRPGGRTRAPAGRWPRRCHARAAVVPASQPYSAASAARSAAGCGSG